MQFSQLSSVFGSLTEKAMQWGEVIFSGGKRNRIDSMFAQDPVDTVSLLAHQLFISHPHIRIIGVYRRIEYLEGFQRYNLEQVANFCTKLWLFTVFV